MQEVSIDSWLASLADRTPTPGGGAAAALSAATSAALIGMVTIYTTGSKWADREPRMRDLNDEAARLRAGALALANEDEVAFAQVGAAYQLPKETPDEKAARTAAIQRALTGAAQPPVRTGRLAARLVELAAELVESGNPNVVSDVAVASSNARAAIDAAIVNIEINRKLIRDDEVTASLSATVAELREAAKAADDVFSQVLAKIT